MIRSLHSRTLHGATLALLGVTAMCAAFALTSAPAHGASAKPSISTQLAHAKHRHVCGQVRRGMARCHAIVLAKTGGTLLASAAPLGYGPSDLHRAYALPASGGAGTTVAIVDAYNDPKAAADLAAYRKRFDLPACGAGSCLRIVNEQGRTSKLPRANPGWAEEISLDLDMASAVCPDCSILLVEAASSSMQDLAASENTAARLGATSISNSFGGAEYAGDDSAASAFEHPGVTITASSGDDGYGVSYPASLPDVIAVGGTSLVRAGGTARGFVESAWSGAGSGCSAYESKPAWQPDAGCASRTVADVSAVADPATGVAVYDSYGRSAKTAWLVVGGTSAASPIVASMAALAGGGATPAGLYAAPASAFDDVTSGSNGACEVPYLCSAIAGYDGPTGLGSPNGLAAF